MARTQAADYEQRREAIVARAATLFAARGFHGASMAELAAACDMSKSLLYHYYASKEELLYAVMLSHIDQLVEDVDKVLARPLEPTEKLERLVHSFMAHYVGAAERQKVLLNDLDNLPGDKKAVIIAKQRTLIDAVQMLLTEISPGRYDADEQRVRTMLLFGMINWTHIWFDPTGPISAGKLADMAIAMATPR